MSKLLRTLPLAILFTAALPGRADTCNGFANNLVSNCSFETGSFSSWKGTATTTGSAYAGVDNGDPFTSAKTPYAGAYEAYLGAYASTVALTQTLATVAGTGYVIDFALLNDTAAASPYTNSFALLFGGTTLFSESAVSAGAYTFYSFLGMAISSATDLSFVSRNDGGYFELDSVSVVPTPEPSGLLLLGTGAFGLVGAARRRFIA